MRFANTATWAAGSTYSRTSHTAYSIPAYRRISRHACVSTATALGSKFTKKYNCQRLVYAEFSDRIEDAIAREKAIKNWPRLWKLRLIQEANPNWDDLAREDDGE